MPLTDNERDIKNISETAQTEREDSREAKPDTISQATVSANNKRIAKNAIMLYLRMFLSMIVGLYTSRVVLDTLGVEDYGTYNVVGGVVAMLGFLNASMSGATSRFMAFELGSGNKKRLAETFSSALIVHMGIALVVFVLAETVGLWFMTHKLVIPEGRMTAAHWVYQCSILGAMLGFTQVPYNATIIAHEKMGVYAYFDILGVTLKLLIVYLLVIGNFDKLKLYAVLGLAVSVIIITIYRIYCIKNFEETHFRFVWKPNLLKPLVSFSAWNLYGNFGGVVQQQGTNFVINIFYGVVMNAAVSVGLTIANVVNLFASNLMTAFRPQIIKYYSQGAKEQMKNLTVLALKIIMFIYSLVAVPVFIEAENLLDIWLVEVPDKSLIICRLFLISIFFETIRYILIINIHASGNVKRVSLAAGTVFILVPFATYLLFKLGLDVKVAVIVIIASNIILCAVNLFLIGYYVKISMRPYAATIAQIAFSSGLALVLAIFVAQFIPSSYIHMITRGVISIALVVFTYTVFCLNKEQRAYAFSFIKSKLKL